MKRTRLAKEEIPAALTRQLEQRPEIHFAYLFGSVAEDGPFRDVDVAVYLRDEGSLKDPLQYSIRLSLELEKEIGYQVDVIVMNIAPDHLIHRISRGFVLVNRDDDLRVDFITSAWSRYFDILPKREQAIRDMFS